MDDVIYLVSPSSLLGELLRLALSNNFFRSQCRVRLKSDKYTHFLIILVDMHGFNFFMI